MAKVIRTEEFDYTQWCDSTGAPLKKIPDRLGVATNGFVRDETGKILLQCRADIDFWSMPGGNVEIGESVEQGVVREVYEETGLEVRVERLIGVYSEPESYPFMSYPDGFTIHYVTHVFTCDHIAGELRLSDESTDIGYFAADNLPKNTLLSHRIRIEDALTGLVSPFIR
jgi:ADP-ribose pyrophosphatase YjhB (NUDIX family)